nr:uncharacterized protein LOC103351456 isoform X2 [Oryctolagus cuniculus]
MNPKNKTTTHCQVTLCVANAQKVCGEPPARLWGENPSRRPSAGPAGPAGPDPAARAAHPAHPRAGPHALAAASRYAFRQSGISWSRHTHRWFQNTQESLRYLQQWPWWLRDILQN